MLTLQKADSKWSLFRNKPHKQSPEKTCISTANQPLENLLTKEWLLTNECGSYASSTIVGCNTLGYHGLLIGSLNPPVNRIMALAYCLHVSCLRFQWLRRCGECQRNGGSYPGICPGHDLQGRGIWGDAACALCCVLLHGVYSGRAPAKRKSDHVLQEDGTPRLSDPVLFCIVHGGAFYPASHASVLCGRIDPCPARGGDV